MSTLGGGRLRAGHHQIFFASKRVHRRCKPKMNLECEPIEHINAILVD
jgi:hypothetical protein